MRRAAIMSHVSTNLANAGLHGDAWVLAPASAPICCVITQPLEELCDAHVRVEKARNASVLP